MNILIINNAEPADRQFVETIQSVLQSIPNLHTQLRHWSMVLNEPDLTGFDAVILSASPKGDNANFNERLKSVEWVKTTPLPVLGICAGHQLIGVLYGATLIQGDEAESGWIPVEVDEPSALFKGRGHSFEVDQTHNDSITLPREFKRLAHSEKCSVQAMQHNEKPIYTVQWHVERCSHDLLQNFIEIARDCATIAHDV